MEKSGVYIILLLLLTSGCDNTFDPFKEDKGVYSIYGYLNMLEDINYIRVKDLSKTLVADSTSHIDAEVTLENLKTGTTQVLQDSVVEFDGVKTHNFRTTMDILERTTYRVTVERSDGRSTTATATTPPLAAVRVDPENPKCRDFFRISFDPVIEKFDIHLEIGIRWEGDYLWFLANDLLKKSGSEVYAQFPINGFLFGRFGATCDDLQLTRLYVRYTHYGPDLFDDTVSDSLNLPGGAGRFGAMQKEMLVIPTRPNV